MKKNTKTTKGLTFNETKPKPIQSRNQSSVVKPSLHPWYYVKGRPDLTEKNISQRREREEQKHRQSVSNSQYFDKRTAETQVYHKWNDNKSLVKHPKQLSNGSLNPPYDVLIEPKNSYKNNPRLNLRANKELEKNYLKAKQKLNEFMQKFKELDENHLKLEKRQNSLVFQLKELRKIKTDIKEKTQFYEMTTKCYSLHRFSRDKLRKKVFQIIHVLEDYKISVKNLQILKSCDGIFTSEESKQLTEVIERSIKILDMYIELNFNRNNEFQILFK